MRRSLIALLLALVAPVPVATIPAVRVVANPFRAALEDCSPLQCEWTAEGVPLCFMHGEHIYVGAVTLTCEYGNWRVDY